MLLSISDGGADMKQQVPYQTVRATFDEMVNIL